MNLHELIEKGDLCGLRQAAADGADMNASFPESDECLLSAAATKGDAELVQLLLTLGANPHHRETVTPPLVAAAAGGSVECVRLILEAGAEIDVRDEDGATPLMVAATYGHTKVVQELLSRNAETKLKDRFGNSALSSAAIKGHSETCNVLLPASSPKERERARIALELHAQGHVDKRIEAFIYQAATNGQLDLAMRLVDEGVAPDSINENGTSALMRAANGNHVEVTRWLLEQGANVNRQDVYGECPLTYAAMGCHPDMYEFLYSLTDKKLRKRAEKIKKNQIEIGNWPSEPEG